MTDSCDRQKTISPEFSHILIQSAIELLGRDDLLHVLKQAYLGGWLDSAPSVIRGLTMAEYHCFQDDMISIFGKLSAQGLMQRIGRIVFCKMRRRIERIKNLGSIEHRMTPLSRRLQADLGELGKILENSLDCTLSAQSTGKDWQITLSGCPGEREYSSLSCYLIKGLLQEFLEWSDSRKDFRMEELVTSNDAESCIFKIQVLVPE